MLPQRLNNPSRSAIIIVMQRLHQNDPTGFLLGQEDSDWTLLKLPLVAEEDEVWEFPVSGRTWKRKKGECLDPKRWSRPSDTRTAAQSPRLERPIPTRAGPPRREFNPRGRCPLLRRPGSEDRFTRSGIAQDDSTEKLFRMDCAFKDKATSDYVAIIVVGIAGSRRYVLHIVNAHLDLTGTENEIRNAHASYGPISAVLVEDKANDQYLSPPT